MRNLMAVLGLLIMSLTVEARLESVKPSVREVTVQEINEALMVHYTSLSANEQWGVGMGCAIGHLENLVRDAKSLQIDADGGLILADSGFRPHLFRGELRELLMISFEPNSEKILSVTVRAIDKRGKVTRCSTRDKLLNF